MIRSLSGIAGQAPFFLISDIVPCLSQNSGGILSALGKGVLLLLLFEMLNCVEPKMKFTFWMILLLAVTAGCGDTTPADPYANTGTNSDPYSSYYGSGEITFVDEASSNASLNAGLTSLSFVSSTGEERMIRDLAPGKTLVVVVTRGNTVPICPYCSTQTAQLISNYEQFQKHGAEVAVVYPIETGSDSERLNSFLEDVKTKLDDATNPVPFPVLLDVELKGVDQLGIRKDLSKPATYIVDSVGNVQYAYVGEHIGDRPSIQAMLNEVEKLKPADSPAAETSHPGEKPVVDPEPEAASNKTTSSEEPAAE
ncbi:MAG: redoxin domain-containing protein, partial [Planctomycetota bacterium]|nr:redoxin domain-containing protein [Planctomycetota bacterium]